MADSVDIFIMVDTTLEELVSTVEAFLGVTEKSYSFDLGEPWYELIEPHTTVAIGENNRLVNDDDFHFEDYRYWIRMWAGGFETLDENWQWEDKRMFGLMQHLKAAYNYECALMITGSGEQKIIEFEPNSLWSQTREGSLRAQAQALPSRTRLYVGGDRTWEQLLSDLTPFMKDLQDDPAQPLLGEQTASGYHFYLPSMNIAVYPDNQPDYRRTSLEGFFAWLLIETRLSLPDGLETPGERRYWMYWYSQKLFEHLKERQHYRLLWLNEDDGHVIERFGGES
ncbi:MAG: hypothetical protein H0W02_04645 [Ktedonobacteraceae bacterium]|nr:hypothetical protein [Ktedonobacteraceae bacterium]